MTFAPFRWLRTVLAWPWKVFTSARFWIALFFVVIVLIVIYYALANRYTPFTNDAYVQAYVIQVAPQVDGQVLRVYVKENQRIEKGALLFEIDPRPFEYQVRRLEASLQQNSFLVAQMDSELIAARAEEAKVAADEAYAKAVFDQETVIYKRDATTERKFLDAKQKHAGFVAMREKAKAIIKQKEQALQAKFGDEHALVAEVQAQLATARLNLAWTKVFAPVSGYVTNLQLQPGSYVAPGKPVLTCIDTDSWWIVANFRESNLEYIREGMPAAIAFKTYPGRVLPATVQSVGWGVSQGQGVPSGELPGIKNPTEWVPAAQRFQVRLVLADGIDLPMRVGATGSVTVYVEPGDGTLNVIGEAWQWLVARLNYLR
ncbi:MAG: HlyD family secretion protein [Gemmataceae bacterium]